MQKEGKLKNRCSLVRTWNWLKPINLQAFKDKIAPLIYNDWPQFYRIISVPSLHGWLSFIFIELIVSGRVAWSQCMTKLSEKITQ